MNEPDVDGPGLSAAFDRTMEGVAPDLGRLVRAGARQGRSIRLRRRLTVAGAVTAVAALVLGGTVALRTPGGGGGTAAAASPSPTAQRYPRPLQYSDDATEQLWPAYGAENGRVVLTAHAALATLIRALPPGARTSGYAGWRQETYTTRPDLPELIRVIASMLYDDGSGPALVELDFKNDLGDYIGTPGGATYEERYGCAILNRSNQFRYCANSTLPDGSRLLLTERAEGGSVRREATVLRPDHTGVSVSASNLAEVEGQAKVQVVREGLPLSLEQVKAAALSPELRSYITVDEAVQAGTTVKPFHDTSPRHSPSAPATPAG